MTRSMSVPDHPSAEPAGTRNPGARRVIINADDLGASLEINTGILESMQEGIVTSTTLLANGRAFDHAVSLLQAHPGLPVGIHLTLLDGVPVSPPGEVPSLVDRTGRFPKDPSAFMQRFLLGGIRRKEMEIEFRAQIQRLIDCGVRPTHLDTHKHIHCLARVFDALTRAGRGFGIHRVRFPLERGMPGSGRAGTGPPPPLPWRALAKRDLIRYLCYRNRARLQKSGMKTTDHFFGTAHTGSLDVATLCFILGNMPPGTTEIACHPGHTAPSTGKVPVPPSPRHRELEALTDNRVRDLVVREKIRLTDYSCLG